MRQILMLLYAWISWVTSETTILAKFDFIHTQSFFQQRYNNCNASLTFRYFSCRTIHLWPQTRWSPKLEATSAVILSRREPNQANTVNEIALNPLVFKILSALSKNNMIFLLVAPIMCYPTNFSADVILVSKTRGIRSHFKDNSKTPQRHGNDTEARDETGRCWMTYVVWEKLVEKEGNPPHCDWKWKIMAIFCPWFHLEDQTAFKYITKITTGDC